MQKVLRLIKMILSTHVSTILLLIVERNAGNAIHNMAYDSYNLSKYGVPNNYITPIPQVNVSVSLPNTNQQDDGYYHPALKPVVSVTAVINGKKKTSTTFIDKDGNTFFQNREE